MEMNLNEQAKNDVKDLLDEYIVSPLNKNINDLLEPIKNSIVELDETLEEKSKKTRSEVRRELGSLEKNLDCSFHFQDEKDVFEDMKESLQKNIQEQSKNTEKSMQSFIRENDEKNLKEISEDIGSSYRHIKSGILDTEKKIMDNLQKIEGDSELHYKEVQKKGEELSLEIRAVVQTGQGNHIESIRRFDEICNEMKREQESNRERINNLEKSFRDVFSQSEDALSSRYEGINAIISASKTELVELAEKKYQTILAASVLLGIVNLLGIVSILILFNL